MLLVWTRDPWVWWVQGLGEGRGKLFISRGTFSNSPCPWKSRVLSAEYHLDVSCIQFISPAFGLPVNAVDLTSEKSRIESLFSTFSATTLVQCVINSHLDYWCSKPVFIPIAAITNYHKLSGLRQHKCIILQFWRSEVQNGSQWSKFKMSVRLLSFLALEENLGPCLFELL